jgi:branched-chain amino acid transport system permease protein
MSAGEQPSLPGTGQGSVGVAGQHEQRVKRGRAPAFWQAIPPGPRSAALGVLVFGLAALYPLVDRDSSHIFTAVSACGYAMLALGLNVVVGYAGLLDLGYAAFYAIGAYAFGMIGSAQFQPGATLDLHIGGVELFNMGPNGIHANFWFFLPLVALVAAFFGVILGAPTLRLRGDYLAIVTLGFGEIVPDIVRNLGVNNIFGWPDITGGENSLSGIDQPKLGAIQFGPGQPGSDQAWYYLSLVVLALIVLISVQLRDSRLGRAWIAIREDEVAASCMGINLTRTKLLAFAMGAFFSGFAGMINGSRLGAINPEDFTFEVSIAILCMVVLGGMGSIPGVIVGALIISELQYSLLDKASALAHSLGNVTHIGYLQTVDLTGAKYLIFGIILVLMMIFRREGILPSRRRSIELHPETLHEQAEENIQLAGLREEA